MIATQREAPPAGKQEGATAEIAASSSIPQLGDIRIYRDTAYPSRHTKRQTRDFVTGGLGRLADRREAPAHAAPAPAAAATPQAAWIGWLSPRFADNDSAYFTGTYTDDYGLSHGLTLPRNVHKDFRLFLVDHGLDPRQFVNGVEHHAYRDVLHLHGIIEGPFSQDDLKLLQSLWQTDRGFAKVLPVQDRCAAYVTKYALKSDTDSFDWNLL